MHQNHLDCWSQQSFQFSELVGAWEFALLRVSRVAETGIIFRKLPEAKMDDLCWEASCKLTLLWLVTDICLFYFWVCSVGKGNWQQSHSRYQFLCKTLPELLHYVCVCHLHNRIKHSIPFRRDAILVWMLNILYTKYNIFIKSIKRKDFKLPSVVDLRIELRLVES